MTIMMMMMIMTDPFTTNLVVKGPVAKGSVVKGAHPAYKAIIITITTVITVAVMTSCEKFTERGRGNCTDVRIDSLNDWRINRCPRVVWTKEILFKISIKSTLVKCFFFIYL